MSKENSKNDAKLDKYMARGIAIINSGNQEELIKFLEQKGKYIDNMIDKKEKDLVFHAVKAEEYGCAELLVYYRMYRRFPGIDYKTQQFPYSKYTQNPELDDYLDQDFKSFPGK